MDGRETLKLACNLVIPFIRDSTRKKEKDTDGQVAWSTLFVTWSSDICPEEDLISEIPLAGC